MKIELISKPYKKDNDKDLNNITEQKAQQIRTEEDQPVVIVFIDIHDLQLYVSDQIRDCDSGDHGRNNRLVLFPSDVKTAVNSMHGDAHGNKGKHRCGKCTVYIPKEDVVE